MITVTDAETSCLPTRAVTSIPQSTKGGGTTSRRKRRKLSVPSSSPPAAPESGWKTFPGCVPKMFNEGHIFHHLVESLHSPVTDDSDTDSHDDSIVLDSHTSKPLREVNNSSTVVM